MYDVPLNLVIQFPFVNCLLSPFVFLYGMICTRFDRIGAVNHQNAIKIDPSDQALYAYNDFQQEMRFIAFE